MVVGLDALDGLAVDTEGNAETSGLLVWEATGDDVAPSGPD